MQKALGSTLMTITIFAVLQFGCSSSSSVQDSNEQFRLRAQLQLTFIYPDSLLVTDQNIQVEVDSQYTLQPQNASVFLDTMVGTHLFRIWDEDGALYRLTTRLITGMNRVPVQLTHRIRRVAPSVTPPPKADLTKYSRVIFAVPTQ